MEFAKPVLFFVFASGCPAADDYVQVSRRNPNYLELSSGKPYIPIGLNMVSPPRGATEDESLRGMEEWLAALEANGGNYIRVWLSHTYWDIEHERSGEYDAEKAKRIDKMLEICRRHGIRVKLTLEHFRTIGETTTQAWADKPILRIQNGGTAASIADFFDGEASREQFRKKIEWYRARYGDQPIVYGWELWNEINAVRAGDYLAWTAAMLPVLHRAFPRNMAMQSLGSFDRPDTNGVYRRHSTLEGNDIAQVHRYLDLGAQLQVCRGPVDVLAADAVRELRGYQPRRPVLLAESGAVEPRHSGPFKLYTRDKEGTILHDVLFAPFFAGAAGPGQIWHWDAYVAANNLWWQFGRFAEATRGIDPVAEAFEPSMKEHDRLRVYVLTGRKTILVWCRDKANDWRSELERQDPPQRLHGISVPLKARNAKAFDPWSSKWTPVKVKNGSVELPEFSRSIVVRADR